MEKMRPSFVVLMGYSLTGKTVLGIELSKSIENSVALDVDQARLELYGETGWLGPHAEAEIMDQSYRLNHTKALDAVRAGQVVILSGVYSRSYERLSFLEMLVKEKFPWSVFWLTISSAEVLKRLQQRVAEGSKSNITTIESYNEQLAHFETLVEFKALKLDGMRPTEENTQLIIDSLKLRE